MPRDPYYAPSPPSNPRAKEVGIWFSVAIAIMAFLLLTEHALDISDSTMDIVYAIWLPPLLGALGIAACCMFKAPITMVWLVIGLTIAGVLLMLHLEYLALVDSFRHLPFG